MNIGPFSIEKHFVVLSPDKKATIELSDSSLYERLNTDYVGFKGHELISCYEFSEDWQSWEIHPKGDEIVVLIAGEAEFILAIDNEYHTVTLLNIGDYAIVPKNTWHTAKIRSNAKILFITPGEHTQHKSLVCDRM